MKCMLRKIRKDKNFKQQDIANSVGVKQTTVSEWENNNNVPSLEKAYEVAKFLDVEVTDIWI